MNQVTHSSQNIYLKCGTGDKLQYIMKVIVEVLYIANYTECYISNNPKRENKQIDNYCWANGNIVDSVKLYNTMINFTRKNRGIMTLEKKELLELKEIHGQRIVDFYNNKCKNKCSQTLAKNIFKSNKAYNDNNNEEEEVKKEVKKNKQNSKIISKTKHYKSLKETTLGLCYFYKAILLPYEDIEEKIHHDKGWYYAVKEIIKGWAKFGLVGLIRKEGKKYVNGIYLRNKEKEHEWSVRGFKTFQQILSPLIKYIKMEPLFAIRVEDRVKSEKRLQSHFELSHESGEAYDFRHCMNQLEQKGERDEKDPRIKYTTDYFEKIKEYFINESMDNRLIENEELKILINTKDPSIHTNSGSSQHS